MFTQITNQPKLDFLSNEEREALFDLPYNEACTNFCNILVKFYNENKIKLSRTPTKLETIVCSQMLFGVFRDITNYNSNVFWSKKMIIELFEIVLTLDLSELSISFQKRGLVIE